jgi:uncharacterized protein (TIRG00374 family)
MNLNKNYLTVLLAFLVFFGLSFFAGLERLISSFSKVKILPVALALFLTVIGYFVRFGKWELYLRRLGIDADLSSSLEVFFSGLMMVVTPGKMGELWKAWLLEKKEGVSKDRTFAVVTAERITDLIALLFFSLLGLFVYSGSKILLYASLAVVVTIILFIKSKRLMMLTVGMMEVLPVVGSYAEEFENFYTSSRELFNSKTLLPAVALSTAAWSLEGLSLFILAASLGQEISLIAALFIFGFSSVIGALSMLPGGLGATEISMTGLLISLGATRSGAVTLTILIRATTLWFGALVGFLVYHLSGLDKRAFTKFNPG